MFKNNVHSKLDNVLNKLKLYQNLTNDCAKRINQNSKFVAE
jgi:hypothetical protein